MRADKFFCIFGRITIWQDRVEERMAAEAAAQETTEEAAAEENEANEAAEETEAKEEQA